MFYRKSWPSHRSRPLSVVFIIPLNDFLLKLKRHIVFLLFFYLLLSLPCYFLYPVSSQIIDFLLSQNTSITPHRKQQEKSVKFRGKDFYLCNNISSLKAISGLNMAYFHLLVRILFVDALWKKTTYNMF